MTLWVDKHRPTNLSKLDYHKDQAQRLKNMVSVFNASQKKGYNDFTREVNDNMSLIFMK